MTKTLITLSMTGACLGFFLTGLVFAQCEGSIEEDPLLIPPEESTIYRPSELISDVIGDSVATSGGKNLGSIQELVINPAAARVAYALVSLGGFWELIDKKILVIPWEAIQVSADRRTLVLGVDEPTLRDAPSFPADRWPDMSNPQWAGHIDRYWEEKLGRSFQATPPRATLYTTSIMIGMKVENLVRRKLGAVEELVINPDSGIISYVVVSIEIEEVEKENHTFFLALPWNAVKFQVDTHTVVVDVDKSTLQEIFPESLLAVSQDSAPWHTL
jgi:sporulation protein YlmC with PRC-barrel domain